MPIASGHSAGFGLSQPPYTLYASCKAFVHRLMRADESWMVSSRPLCAARHIVTGTTSLAAVEGKSRADTLQLMSTLMLPLLLLLALLWLTDLEHDCCYVQDMPALAWQDEPCLALRVRSLVSGRIAGANAHLAAYE